MMYNVRKTYLIEGVDLESRAVNEHLDRNVETSGSTT